MLTADQIRCEVKQLGEEQPWWHDIELPHGIRTCPRTSGELQANHNVVKWSKIESCYSFHGKRILDLACNEGFFSIEVSRAGASEVVGVDINPLRIKKARFVHKLLKLQNVQFEQGDVYRLGSQMLGGRFSVVLCLGLLHRVPDPFGLIRVVSELADTVILEWATLDTEEPLMKFWTKGHKQDDEHNSGYWTISPQCVREMLWRTGFQVYVDIEGAAQRAVLIASAEASPRDDQQWKSLKSSIAELEDKQLHQTVREIVEIVPTGASFILVDQRWLVDTPVPDRVGLLFNERDGEYWGNPEHDESAIGEIERLREQGARYVVFVEPAFWWLEYYVGFRQYLQDNYCCVCKTDRLIAFRL